MPHESVAVHVRVIVDSCGQAPEATESSKVRSGSSSQLSVAVASPVLVGSVDSSHSIVTSSGHVMVGGVVSTTVMIWTHSSVLPQASVAVHVRMMNTSGA